MTSTKERVRKAVFGKLMRLRRKLAAQGVPCTYARSVLSHDDGINGFTITYQAGDTARLPQITIRMAEGNETFDGGTFEQGLVRIKEHFSPNDRTTGDVSKESPVPIASH